MYRHRTPCRNGVGCNGLENKETELERHWAIMVVSGFPQRDWENSDLSVSWLKYLST